MFTLSESAVQIIIIACVALPLGICLWAALGTVLKVGAKPKPVRTVEYRAWEQHEKAQRLGRAVGMPYSEFQAAVKASVRRHAEAQRHSRSEELRRSTAFTGMH